MEDNFEEKTIGWEGGVGGGRGGGGGSRITRSWRKRSVTKAELNAEAVAEEEEEGEEEEEEEHSDQAYGAGGSADLKMKWDTEKS